jgi:hypothetical protein
MKPIYKDQVSNQPLCKDEDAPPVSLQRSNEQSIHKFTDAKAGPSPDDIMGPQKGGVSGQCERPQIGV